MDPIITTRKLSFTYHGVKQPTIQDLTFSIWPGEKVLIAGPSGSGKSTLARCLNGLIPNSYRGNLQGLIKINGVNLQDATLRDLSHRVGTVLQDPEGQFVGLTVGEDVSFALENQRVPQNIMDQLVKSVLQQVGMESYVQHTPHQLSGGQKQKIALAGVLVLAPDILLFDEPFANLDPASTIVMMQLINELNVKHNKTILIIEHRIEEVFEMGVDRVLLLHEGQLIANQSPHQILASGYLKEIGIRHPLFLEALENANIRFFDEAPCSINEWDVQYDELEKVYDWVGYEKFYHNKTFGSNTIVDLERVSFSYDKQKPLLKNISLDIREHERIALLGHNGAGKSTLSQILLGILKPDSGNVYLNGNNSATWSIADHGEVIGYVMQNPHHMLSQETVWEEVAFGPRNYGFEENEVEYRVAHALEVCGLKGYRNWPISALSFGQKKRVSIASVLSMKPKLLLLDEPTAGQDYRHYRDMMQFINSLTHEGIALLMATHDMHLALEYTDRSIVLSDGRIIADAPTVEVFSDQELLEAAKLRTTSLYGLAERLNIAPVSVLYRFLMDNEQAVYQ